MYRCVECEHLFEDGEELIYTESHGEKLKVCPCCRGGFEVVHQCDKCRNWFSEDELYEGMCADCLAGQICYGTALKYFQSRDIVVDFMVGKWYEEKVVPSKPSEKLKEAMEQNFKRTAAEEMLLDRHSFYKAIAEYIMEDDGNMGKQDFAEFLVKENMA